MKEIFFPGNARQPCKAQYGIVLNNDSTISRATIVVHQDEQHNQGTAILNAAYGRESILNAVLETDLRGVRVEFVSFVTMIERGQGQLEAREYPIHVDADDFVARGNRHNIVPAQAEDWSGALLNLIGRGNRKVSFWSGDVVGGCARFYLDEKNSKGLSQGEAGKLLKAAKKE